jgi:hypothetical protein
MTTSFFDSIDTVSVPRDGETRDAKTSLRALEEKVDRLEAQRTALGDKGAEVTLKDHDMYDDGAVGVITSNRFQDWETGDEFVYINVRVTADGTVLEQPKDVKARPSAKVYGWNVAHFVKNHKAIELDERIATLTERHAKLLDVDDAS